MTKTDKQKFAELKAVFTDELTYLVERAVKIGDVDYARNIAKNFACRCAGHVMGHDMPSVAQFRENELTANMTLAERIVYFRNKHEAEKLAA